jgi:hypothetical protein
MNKQDSVPPNTSSALGLLSASAIYARTIIANIVQRLVIRRVRSRLRVASDHDQGEWRDLLNERRWDDCKSLKDYVLSTETRPITALVEGRLSRIPTRDYYVYRTKKLLEILERFASDTGALVEIGSGAWRSLFALAHSGRWPRILGLELSPTGREDTRLVAGRFAIASINTVHIDLLNPSSEGFANLRGATVFSFYCLEQLPAHTYELLSNLLHAAVRRVIHIEPTSELFDYSSFKDLATISDTRAGT